MYPIHDFFDVRLSQDDVRMTLCVLQKTPQNESEDRSFPRADQAVSFILCLRRVKEVNLKSL